MPALATAVRMGFVAAIAAGCALPPIGAAGSDAPPPSMAAATPPVGDAVAPAPTLAMGQAAVPAVPAPRSFPPFATPEPGSSCKLPYAGMCEPSPSVALPSRPPEPTPWPGPSGSPQPRRWSGPGFAFTGTTAWRQVGEDEGTWRVITFWRSRGFIEDYVAPPLVLALEGAFGPFRPRVEVRKGPPGGRADLAADAARLSERFGHPTEATLGGAPSLRFRMQEESPHEVFTHYGYEVVERGGASWHLWWGTATNAELWPDHAEQEKAILAAIEAIRASWTWQD